MKAFPGLEKLISKDRFQRYLRATNYSYQKAFELYLVNLKVSQSFYIPLSVFEIIFRNQLYNSISLFLKDSDWIVNNKDNIFNSPSLKHTNFYIRRNIQKAQIRIKRKGQLITRGKLIAEQTLGFWTAFFEPDYFRVLNGSALNCFPLKPGSENRRTINTKLKQIRSLRNRIYHNEPICFQGKNINFAQCLIAQKNITDLLNWTNTKSSRVMMNIELPDKFINPFNE